jgi:hypothetical protein
MRTVPKGAEKHGIRTGFNGPGTQTFFKEAASA